MKLNSRAICNRLRRPVVALNLPILHVFHPLYILLHRLDQVLMRVIDRVVSKLLVEGVEHWLGVLGSDGRVDRLNRGLGCHRRDGLVPLLDPRATIRARAGNVVADVLEDALPSRQPIIRALLEPVNIVVLVGRRRLIMVTQHRIRLEADGLESVRQPINVGRVLIGLQVVGAGAHYVGFGLGVIILF